MSPLPIIFSIRKEKGLDGVSKHLSLKNSMSWVIGTRYSCHALKENLIVERAF